MPKSSNLVETATGGMGPGLGLGGRGPRMRRRRRLVARIDDALQKRRLFDQRRGRIRAVRGLTAELLLEPVHGTGPAEDLLDLLVASRAQVQVEEGRSAGEIRGPRPAPRPQKSPLPHL